MTLGTSIKRAAAIAITTAATFAISGAAASAHYIDIDAPGNGETKTMWVGGPTLNQANGEGLIEGGPTGEDLLAPAHAKGLNQACESLRANGNGVVDIYGPPHQSMLPPGVTSGCAHGAVISP